MSTTNGELLREAIRRTLAPHAREDDAGAVADATLNLWQQMVVRLAPVIGARGVDALFSRALHLTKAAFPWFADVEDSGEGAVLLASLRAHLAAPETSTAVEASCALLATFAELLATLIGESLTEHLLDPVWAPPPSPQQENSPCATK